MILSDRLRYFDGDQDPIARQGSFRAIIAFNFIEKTKTECHIAAYQNGETNVVNPLKIKSLHIFILAIATVAAWHTAASELRFEFTPPMVTLTGTTDSKAAIILLPTEQVSELLPAELELVSDAAYPVDRHPILLMFNVVSDLRLAEGIFPAFKPYHEVILAVTNVRIKGKKQIYTFFNKLYLDSLGPTILGYYYGFPKHLGTFYFEDGANAGQSIDGKRVARMDFMRSETYDNGQFQKNYELFKHMMDMPVVADGYGPLICSEAIFDYENAVAYPIDATVQLDPELRSPVAGTYRVVGIDQTAAGAISFKASAILRGPIPCK
jgi:hypothetical protein